MVNVLIHHEVADYSVWKAAFDSAFEWRHKHGERNCRIFRSAGNVNDVTLFFEWESLESGARISCLRRTECQNGKCGSHRPPRIDLLTEVHSVRRSAAD